MDTVARLAAVLALVFANGFFVAAEFALVSVRRSRMEELARHSRIAGLVLRAKDDPNRFISVAQLGITMASLALGWIGEEAIAGLLIPFFDSIPTGLSQAAAHSVAVGISFALITFMHIVLGEQVPKMVALQFADQTAMATVGPTEVFFRVFRPFIWLLAGATNLVLRLLRIDNKAADHGGAPTSEELEFLFHASHRAGVLAEEERDLLVNVLDYADLVARDIMVPRPDVVAIEVDTPIDQVLGLVDESPHSRFPVFEDSLDNVIGVLHIRSLLRALLDPRESSERAGPSLPDGIERAGPSPTGRKESLRALLREPLFVPESMPLPQLFARFRAERTPVAIVVDEYGGIAGLVTVEDVVEEIFGDVSDEFHVEPPEAVKQPDGTTLLSPRLHLRDLGEHLGLDVESLDEEEADTIAGLVQDRLGRLPEPGDEVALEFGAIRVETMDGPRIKQLRFIPSERVGSGEG